MEELLLDWLYSFLTVEEQDCQTMVGCNLRQKQLQQSEHLKKRCKLWSPTWQKEISWIFKGQEGSEVPSLPTLDGVVHQARSHH